MKLCWLSHGQHSVRQLVESFMLSNELFVNPLKVGLSFIRLAFYPCAGMAALFKPSLLIKQALMNTYVTSLKIPIASSHLRDYRRQIGGSDRLLLGHLQQCLSTVLLVQLSLGNGFGNRGPPSPTTHPDDKKPPCLFTLRARFRARSFRWSLSFD